jgi:hypothetical protein
MIDRLLCLSAKALRQAYKGFVFRACIAVVKGFTPICIASPSYTRRHRKMLASAAPQKDIGRV